MTWRWPSTAETCRHRRTNKLRYLDSCVLTDLPTLISIKHNGDDKPEDISTNCNGHSKHKISWKSLHWETNYSMRSDKRQTEYNLKCPWIMLLVIKKFHIPICLILFIIYRLFWLGLKSEALFIIIKHSLSFWIPFQLDIYSLPRHRWFY